MEAFIEGLFDLNSPVGGYVPSYIATFIFFVLTFIEISPIKVNPWKWIARTIGKWFSADTLEEIKGIRAELKDVNDKLENHLKDDKAYKEEEKTYKEAEQVEKQEARKRRMLIFSDEIREGKNHSQEHYNQIIEDLDDYEAFCNSHPDYTNNKANASASLIKKSYNEKLENNNFLSV